MTVTVLSPRIKYEPRVEVDGLIIEWNEYELLEELETIDGYFNTLVIYDRFFADKLVALELACRSSRGGYSKGKKFTQWWKANQEAIGEGLRESAEMMVKEKTTA